jgi:DNA-binding transcriptional regulator YdaS (Cro superfamily)
MTSIKAIFRHAVEKAGGRKATAELLGVGTPELSLWGNDDHERFIPINHLMDLDAATGDIFLRDWARKRGYDLTALEVSEPKDNIYKIIGELSKAGGNLDCAALEAWSDNI